MKYYHTCTPKRDNSLTLATVALLRPKVLLTWKNMLKDIWKIWGMFVLIVVFILRSVIVIDYIFTLDNVQEFRTVKFGFQNISIKHSFYCWKLLNKNYICCMKRQLYFLSNELHKTKLIKYSTGHQTWPLFFIVP